jgi:hypothetical protein
VVHNRAWRRGSSERVMAALLADRMGVGAVLVMPIPCSRVRNQMHSFAASNPAMCSASWDDPSTFFCLHAFHKTTPDLSENAYPLTLHLMSKQFAQSESEKTRRLTLEPPTHSLRSHDPFRFSQPVWRRASECMSSRPRIEITVEQHVKYLDKF